jgi:hypothetical protein
MRGSTAPHKCYVCLKRKVKGRYVVDRSPSGLQQWACDRCIKTHDIEVAGSKEHPIEATIDRSVAI